MGMGDMPSGDNDKCSEEERTASHMQITIKPKHRAVEAKSMEREGSRTLFEIVPV